MKRWIGEDVGKERQTKNGGTPLRLWWVYKFNFKFGAKIIKSSKLYFLIRNNEFQIINLSYTYFKYQVTSNKQTIRKKERKKLIITLTIDQAKPLGVST